MPLKLLIAADADLRRALIEQFLHEKDFLLAEAESAASALALMEASQPELLLVCSAFEPPTASSLLQRAREAGFSAPTILLAEREMEIEPVVGFNAVLMRPFRFARLMSLIRALGSMAKQETIASCDVDPPLTEKEAALLTRLARAAGEVVARETLLREIWGYSPTVATHTLETHIHRLRRKLEQSPHRRLTLQTAPGGYLLATDAALTGSAARK